MTTNGGKIMKWLKDFFWPEMRPLGPTLSETIEEDERETKEGVERGDISYIIWDELRDLDQNVGNLMSYDFATAISEAVRKGRVTRDEMLSFLGLTEGSESEPGLNG